MHRFIIKNTQLISPETLLLTLQPKRKKDKLDFYPGQYAAIGFKKHGRPSPMRCFSIVSSPNNPHELQFSMRVRGDFTSAIAELDIGSKVFVRGPFGDFVVDKEYDRNIILLAGGIGITPFMSMIRYATESKASTPITLLYGCRSQHNIPFYKELVSLEKQNPHFRVAFFITSGEIDKLQGSRAVRGRIGEARMNEVTGGRYNSFTYFLCGPKDFMKSIKGTLRTHNTDPSLIVTEEFTPTTQLSSSIAPKDSASRWTYAFSGASLALGIVFIMSIDLLRAVPKIANAQTAQTTSTTQSQPTTTTPVDSPAPSTTSDSSTSSPSSTSTPTSTSTSPTSTSTTPTPPATVTQQQTVTTQPTQVYQAPVTSVS